MLVNTKQQPIIDKSKLISGCIELNKKIDFQKMRNEVDMLPSDIWKDERSRDHADASSCFLKGYPARQQKPSDEREILKSLPYIKTWLASLEYGKLANVLLAKLKPMGTILLHIDGSPELLLNTASYFSTTIRIHISIKSNASVKFYCNNQFYKMCEGSLYVINNSALHGVINESTTEDRIHLILDVWPTEEFIEYLAHAKVMPGYNDAASFQKILNASKP